MDTMNAESIDQAPTLELDPNSLPFEAEATARKAYFDSFLVQLSQKPLHLEAAEASIIECFIRPSQSIIGPLRKLPMSIMLSHAMTMGETEKEATRNETGNNKMNKIEEDIRRAKLREMNRMKEELSKRLEILNENASLLQKGSLTSSKATLNQSAMSGIAKQPNPEKTQEDAASFVQRMRQEKLDRRHKEEERKRQLLERHTQEMDRQEQEFRAREDATRVQRKADMEQAYRKLRLEREEEKRRRMDFGKRGTTAPKDEGVYLYKRLEDKYNREVVLPMLEEKKQELAKKRNMMKPLTLQELGDHKRTCEQKLREHEEAKAKELMERRVEEEKLLAQQKKFKTNLSLKYSLRELKDKEEQERRVEEKRQRRAKMQNYANLVKEIFPAKPSEAKAAELKHKIEQLRHPVRQSRDTRKQYDLSLINATSRKKVREPRSHSILPQDKLRSIDNIALTHIEVPPDILGRNNIGSLSTKKVGSVERRKPQQSQSRRALQKAIEDQESINRQMRERRKKVDYLGEMRKKRENVGNNTDFLARPNWAADLKDTHLNSVEKCNRVVDKANRIEEKARMEERVLQARGGTEKNPELCENVTDMFIDAIKAKLAVLEQI